MEQAIRLAGARVITVRRATVSAAETKPWKTIPAAGAAGRARATESPTAAPLTAIAADPKHPGARIGLTAVLHTWGSAWTHHPHVHCIVPDGGISPARGEEDASPTGTNKSGRWVSRRPGFFPPVRVLSRLFRRLFLEKLAAAHDAGRLRFFGDHRHLADARAFAGHLAPLRNANCCIARIFAHADFRSWL